MLLRRLPLPCLLLLTGGCCTTGALPGLPLPDVRQSTGYTCSAAALQAVLAYYGIEEREDRLSQQLGATPQAGAPPPAIVRVARAHGLTAELRQGMTIEELSEAVANGTPVLIALQAWGDKPPGGYRNDWDDGHYVVVVGVQGDEVLCEDPSILGSRGSLTRAELEERWHDTDGTTRYVHMGLLFGGPAPAPAPPRIPIE